MFGVGDLIHRRYRVTAVPHKVPGAHVYDVHNIEARRKRHWLKLYWSESMLWQKRQQRTEAELEVLPNLTSPYFVQPVSIDALPDGRPYMVVEFAEGQLMLFAITNRDPAEEPVTVERAIEIAVHLVDAVDGAYRDNKVLHCALNPGSIYLRRTWRPLILDLQYAKIDGKSVLGPLDVASIPDEVLRYMAPEVVANPRNSHLLSELYSICATLYFLLCGAPPIEKGDGPFGLHEAVYDRPPIPLRQRQVRGHVPRRLEEIVLKGLAKNPRDRFRSLSELRAELMDILWMLRSTEQSRGTVDVRDSDLLPIGEAGVMAAFDVLLENRRDYGLYELHRSLNATRREATFVVRAIGEKVEEFRNGDRTGLTDQENAALDAITPKKTR